MGLMTHQYSYAFRTRIGPYRMFRKYCRGALLNVQHCTHQAECSKDPSIKVGTGSQTLTLEHYDSRHNRRKEHANATEHQGSQFDMLPTLFCWLKLFQVLKNVSKGVTLSC
jgi:hypothetical protein